MTEKSVIIIGAGLAGLSTGIYARMNGYRTHIFEHHTAPGGVCTAWKRKGYTIDGCIHRLMGAKPGSSLPPPTSSGATRATTGGPSRAG